VQPLHLLIQRPGGAVCGGLNDLAAQLFGLLLRSRQQAGQQLQPESVLPDQPGVGIVAGGGGELLHGPCGGALLQQFIGHDPDRGRRQKSVGVGALMLDALEDKDRLQQQFIIGQRFERADGAVAFLVPEHEVNRADDHRMVPGEEFNILMAEGHAPVEGDHQLLALEGGQRKAGLRQQGEIQLPGALAYLFGDNAIEVEDPDHQLFEFAGFVHAGDGILQGAGLLRPAGVEGEQPVLTFP